MRPERQTQILHNLHSQTFTITLKQHCLPLMYLINICDYCLVSRSVGKANNVLYTFNVCNYCLRCTVYSQNLSMWIRTYYLSLKLFIFHQAQIVTYIYNVFWLGTQERTSILIPLYLSTSQLSDNYYLTRDRFLKAMSILNLPPARIQDTFIL